MDETKYSKYFITAYEEPKHINPWAPNVKPKDETHLLRVDANNMKGIPCYAQCNWFWPSIVMNKIENRSTKPHSHKYDEIIGMVGTNPDDPHDLCGEIEINIGDEKHIVTKSCLIYIPAGQVHGPFRQIKMDRPIFEFEFGLNGIHD